MEKINKEILENNEKETFYTGDVCLSKEEVLKKEKEIGILKKQLAKLIFLNKSSITNCVPEIHKLKKIIAKEKMKINNSLTK